MCLDLGLGPSRGPGEGVPVDFQVGVQAQAARRAGAKDSFQIDQNRLGFARRKAQVGRGDGPAAEAVGHLQAQTARRGVLPVADGDVDRTVGRADPAGGEEPERTARRSVVAKIDFYIMIPRDALIRAAPEEIEVAFVAGAGKVGQVVSAIIPDAGDRLRRRGHMHRQHGRREGEAFVHKHLGPRRVIDHHQRDVVEEVCLPQFGGDTHVVEAVARHELIAANLDPVLGRHDAGGLLGVDAQP